jgi:hypothetical protein
MYKSERFKFDQVYRKNINAYNAKSIIKYAFVVYSFSILDVDIHFLAWSSLNMFSLRQSHLVDLGWARIPKQNRVF